MALLTFSFDTPTSTGMILAALTDFTDRRPSLWPDLDPEAYRVEKVEGTHAIVREGSRTPRVWALEAYDWSTEDTVRWTVRESNFCAPGSFVSLRVEPAGSGSRVHVTWDRTGVGLKGKLIVGLIRATKGKPLATSMSKAIDGLAVHAR